MTDLEFSLLVFAAVSFGYIWYLRYTQRAARRTWGAYFAWVKRGGRDAS